MTDYEISFTGYIHIEAENRVEAWSKFYCMMAMIHTENARIESERKCTYRIRRLNHDIFTHKLSLL